MSEQTHPAGEPGSTMRVPENAEVVGHAKDVDPDRPMTIEELEAIRDQADIESELDRLGPTAAGDGSKADSRRPIAILMLPLDVTAAGGILLEIDKHFPGAVVEMQGDRMHVFPKPTLVFPKSTLP